jgi:hypothetical protein
MKVPVASRLYSSALFSRIDSMNGWPWNRSGIDFIKLHFGHKNKINFHLQNLGQIFILKILDKCLR